MQSTLSATTPAQASLLVRKKLNFSDPRVAFEGTSTLSLLRGAAVLTACSQPWLVRRSEPLLRASHRVLGPAATEALVRHTFFSHFVGGEDAVSIEPRLRALRERGVGGILDYAAEAKLDADGIGASQEAANQPARTYPYESEETCDANRDIFLSAVAAVHETSPEGFAAIKVTALGDAGLLERTSASLVAVRRFFDALGADEAGSLGRRAFVSGWVDAFDASHAEAEALFDRIDRETGDGSLDAIEFTNAIRLEELPALVGTCRSQGPLFASALTPDEVCAFSSMMERLEAIAAEAHRLGVRLMVDAEHTYFQPCIDLAVLRLQRKFNREYPCVFNTYQAYLRDCGERLATDLERARREDWHFGAKLVRGAYMVHERKRASEMGYPDPIQPSAEATHRSYDAALERILLAPPSPSTTSLVLATHNQASIERAAGLLLGGASSVPSGRVYFAQLLGMADHLTFTLGSSGFKAYKYVPYGPVSEVLPYLIRRAQENSDALSGALEQRGMMLAEVRRRWLGR